MYFQCVSILSGMLFYNLFINSFPDFVKFFHTITLNCFRDLHCILQYPSLVDTFSQFCSIPLKIVANITIYILQTGSLKKNPQGNIPDQNVCFSSSPSLYSIQLYHNKNIQQLYPVWIFENRLVSQFQMPQAGISFINYS